MNHSHVNRPPGRCPLHQHLPGSLVWLLCGSRSMEFASYLLRFYRESISYVEEKNNPAKHIFIVCLLRHGSKELDSSSMTVLPCSCFPTGVTLSRSEGSLSLGLEMLRCAQYDNALLRQGSNCQATYASFERCLTRIKAFSVCAGITNVINVGLEPLHL
jgi:hypothetical protein